MRKQAAIWLFILVIIAISGVSGAVFAFAQNDVAIISDLDWSPDGSQIAIGISARGMEARCVASPTLTLLDAASKQIINFPQIDRNCSITNVDFSADGSQLLTTSDSFIAVWNVATGQRLPGLRSETLFKRPAWRPNSTLFLDVDGSGIDIRDAAHLDKSYPGMISPGRLDDIVFTDSVWSPDGKLIASSSSDGKIYIWDADNQTILRTFTEHTVAVERLVWNAALNLIASGDDSGRILIWNPVTGDIAGELSRHTGAIRDLDWTTDGQQLASAGADDTLRTWEWPSGDMQLVENDQSIWSVAYSPDGSQLAYGAELSDPQDIASHIFITSTLHSTIPLTPTATTTD